MLGAGRLHLWRFRMHPNLLRDLQQNLFCCCLAFFFFFNGTGTAAGTYCNCQLQTSDTRFNLLHKYTMQLVFLQTRHNYSARKRKTFGILIAFCTNCLIKVLSCNFIMKTELFVTFLLSKTKNKNPQKIKRGINEIGREERKQHFNVFFHSWWHSTTNSV